jgi:hypothetical protein
MAKRATIGDSPLSPLDQLISQPSASTATLERAIPQNQNPEGEKVRATFYLAADLMEELRNATVQLSGPPVFMNLAKLAENAFRNELARIKKEYHGVKDFPQRPQAVRTGRPITA